MTALVLTILCSSSIALILKYNDARGGDPLILLSGNYLVAAGIGFVFFLSDENRVISLETIVFAVFLGFLFVFSFFSFAKAVGAAGTALATVSSRLSVVVPLFLSITLFSEEPSILQIIGFIFTLFTVILFYHSLKSGKDRKLNLTDFFYLFMVMFGIGISDFCLKIFQHWRVQNEKSLFIFVIFLSAFIYTSIVIYQKNIPFHRNVFIRGTILGIPNVFSTVFLLMALAKFEAIIVYPITNIGIILLTTLGASLIWKEKLNPPGVVALVSGVLAIVFLSF